MNPLIPYVDVDISIDGPLVWTTLLVALACGLGARVFAYAANTARTVRTRLRPWLGAVIGSLSLVILAWIAWRCTDSWVTLGPGHVMFDWALSATRDAWLLLLILLLHAAATVVCVFGGGGGGVFTSLTATGAMVGCIAAALLGQPDNLFLPPRRGSLPAQRRVPDPHRRHDVDHRVGEWTGIGPAWNRLCRDRSGMHGRQHHCTGPIPFPVQEL